MKTEHEYFSHRFAKFLRQQFAQTSTAPRPTRPSTTTPAPQQIQQPSRVALNPMNSAMLKSQLRPLSTATPTSVKPIKMQRNRDAMLKKKNDTGFTVFNDENTSKKPATRTLPFQHENQQSWNYLPTTQEAHKENKDKATAWTGHLIPQQAQLTLIQAPNEEFCIFEDDNAKH
jgi:hypothetical protein